MNNTVGKLSAAASKLTPFPKCGQPPAPIPFYSYYLYVILKNMHIYTHTQHIIICEIYKFMEEKFKFMPCRLICILVLVKYFFLPVVWFSICNFQIFSTIYDIFLHWLDY